MNERPTPETDAEESDGWSADCYAVHPDFARRLERERDEAREQAEQMREAIKEAYEALSQLANWRYECDNYDEDMQLPQRDYDEEQVEMMEKTADAALTKLQPFLDQ